MLPLLDEKIFEYFRRSHMWVICALTLLAGWAQQRHLTSKNHAASTFAGPRFTLIKFGKIAIKTVREQDIRTSLQFNA